MPNAINKFRAGSLIILLLSFGLLRSTTASQKADDEAVYVGILDDAREELRNWKEGVAEHRLIMPLFEKNISGWKAIKSFEPKEAKWTIAFDGRNLGSVESQRKADGDELASDYSRAKQQILTPVSEIPSVGTPSTKFAGVFSPGPAKFRRPLVAVSKTYFKDPDTWKRVTLSDEILRLVRKGFRTQFPHVDRCAEEQIAEKTGSIPTLRSNLLLLMGLVRILSSSLFISTLVNADGEEFPTILPTHLWTNGSSFLPIDLYTGSVVLTCCLMRETTTMMVIRN